MTPDVACPACLAWIESLTLATADQLRTAADDLNITVPEARQRLLAAYHHYHRTEETP